MFNIEFLLQFFLKFSIYFFDLRVSNPKYSKDRISIDIVVLQLRGWEGLKHLGLHKVGVGSEP